MTRATMANVNAALKEDIQPGMAEQLDTSYIFLSQIEKNTKDVEGRHAIIKAHVGRNNGTGARPVGGDLPDPGHQKYVETKVKVIRNYGAMGIDGDLIAASATDKGSVVRHLEAETKGLLEDLKFEVNRQIYNESFQSLVTCGVTTASTTVVLAGLDKSQLRHLFVGMSIDIGTEADSDVIATEREIMSINPAGPSIVISGAAVTTIAGTHRISRAKTEGNELTGLRHIISDTEALQELDPATAGQEVWKSSQTDVSGLGTEAVYEVAIEDIETVSGKSPNLLMTTKGVRRNFKNQLLSNRRYVDNLDIKGGFKAISIAAGNTELPLAVDDDCPSGEAFIVNTMHIQQYVMGPSWTFMDRDGSVLQRVVGKDAYQATLYNYHQLGTDQRNTHGRLSGLTES